VQDIYSIGIQQVLKKKLPVIGGIISLYYRNLEKTIMKNSEQIVVISDEFKSVIQEWASGKKITTIENWAPLDEIRPQPKKNHWSVSQGISDKFCFLYSGTLGMKHNPEILLQLALHYRHDKDTIIVIISEGIGAEWLKVEVANQKLVNVKFYNYFDFEMFPLVLSSADVLIAILEKTAGIFSVPSKVLSYHCIGRPLLLSIPNDNLASKIVRTQKSGFAHDSDDMDGFILSADTLKKDLNLRLKMGENARNYAEHKFNIDKKCNSFIEIF
jgi:glycosyltransferase involved in cell wall biosynthesis